MPIRAMPSITQPARASRSWPGHRRQHRQRPWPRSAVRGHRLVVGLGRRGVRRDELDGIAGSHAHRRSSTGSGPSAISAPVPTRSPIRGFERRGHRAVVQRRGVETRQGRPAARAGTWMTTRAAQRRPLRGSERRAGIGPTLIRRPRGPVRRARVAHGSPQLLRVPRQGGTTISDRRSMNQGRSPWLYDRRACVTTHADLFDWPARPPVGGYAVSQSQPSTNCKDAHACAYNERRREAADRCARITAGAGRTPAHARGPLARPRLLPATSWLRRQRARGDRHRRSNRAPSPPRTTPRHRRARCPPARAPAGQRRSRPPNASRI
jgi:hypothetical protein